MNKTREYWIGWNASEVSGRSGDPFISETQTTSGIHVIEYSALENIHRKLLNENRMRNKAHSKCDHLLEIINKAKKILELRQAHDTNCYEHDESFHDPKVCYCGAAQVQVFLEELQDEGMK